MKKYQNENFGLIAFWNNPFVMPWCLRETLDKKITRNKKHLQFNFREEIVFAKSPKS